MRSWALKPTKPKIWFGLTLGTAWENSTCCCRLQSVAGLPGQSSLFLDNPWKAQKFRTLCLRTLLIGHLILYFLMKPLQEWLSFCTHCEPYYKSNVQAVLLCSQELAVTFGGNYGLDFCNQHKTPLLLCSQWNNYSPECSRGFEIARHSKREIS